MYDSKTFELAGFTERAIALLIDSIIFGFIGGIFGLNIDLIGGSLLSIVLGAAYQWYFLTQHDGQTLGKMFMGLQVIKVDGTPISDADAILRYVGYMINTPIFLAGWLWALTDSNNQGWHDKIAKTYVVKKA